MNKRFFVVAGLLIVISLVFYACHVSRVMVYWTPNITDFKIFPSRPLKKATEPFQFKRAKQPIDFSHVCYKGGVIDLDKYNEDRTTTAFLIIRNDTILFEKYYDNCNDSTVSGSFSIAKAFTSTLIGCAIDDGLIRSVDQPVREFLPAFKPEFDNVTIDNLLQMTTGLKCREEDPNPFTGAARTYYGANERNLVYGLQFKAKPGTRFEYQSVNTVVLGLILENVLKKQGKTITQYLQEKLWTPLQMEYDATWSIDGNRSKLEKVYCCLNARARDFAKLGRLYLNNGNWDGKQIVSQKWTDMCRTITEEKGAVWYYQHGWYIGSRFNNDFYASGYRGQYVYVFPKKNVIIVRLGKKRDGGWVSLFKDLSKIL